MINDLRKVEKIAALSKLGRLMHNPLKYVFAIALKDFIYPRRQKEVVVTTDLFYGNKMKIALPASTDIYLTSGKSHSSEIRLAKFLIHNLKNGNHFLDIGAHYGYFTLIASEMVGNDGLVFSFEPTVKSFSILADNIALLKNTFGHNKAISNTTDNIIFHEFKNLQSEYNSSNIAQFENEEWFRNAPPSKTEVAATTIDVLVQQTILRPDIIKIDVEGAEDKVIQGGINYFQANAPKIVMEYLEPKRNNQNHKIAEKLLLDAGYHTNIIAADGTLQGVGNIDDYLISHNLESDNIVFCKR